MIVHYGLGFVAGILSLFAPCVFPLLPIVIGSSAKSSKLGPYAMALGLTVSFTIFGILTSAFSSLFDVEVVQKIGAAILILIGFVFLLPKLKDKFVNSLSFLSNSGHSLQSKVKTKGALSDFVFGTILGMVWGPCSGPTLAFAFGLATQTEKIAEASFIFFLFGLGAGLGLVVLGHVLLRFSFLKNILMKNINTLNKGMGIVSITIGVLILSGNLLALEEAILQIMPDWLVAFSSRL